MFGKGVGKIASGELPKNIYKVSDPDINNVLKNLKSKDREEAYSSLEALTKKYPISEESHPDIAHLHRRFCNFQKNKGTVDKNSLISINLATNIFLKKLTDCSDQENPIYYAEIERCLAGKIDIAYELKEGTELEDAATKLLQYAEKSENYPYALKASRALYTVNYAKSEFKEADKMITKADSLIAKVKDEDASTELTHKAKIILAQINDVEKKEIKTQLEKAQNLVWESAKIHILQIKSATTTTKVNSASGQLVKDMILSLSIDLAKHHHKITSFPSVSYFNYHKKLLNGEKKFVFKSEQITEEFTIKLKDEFLKKFTKQVQSFCNQPQRSLDHDYFEGINRPNFTITPIKPIKVPHQAEASTHVQRHQGPKNGKGTVISK